MSTLDRSLAAAMRATPEQDALTLGASVFFDVPYADVTAEQRASWKLATTHMRHTPEPPSRTPAEIEQVRRGFLRAWPAMRAYFGESTP